MSENKAKSHAESRPSEASFLAARIQSTIISNTLTAERWQEHITECLAYRFQAAMIPAAWVKKTAAALEGTGILVASFVDFPYGTMTSAGKAYEAARLVEEGAVALSIDAGIAYLKNASGGAVGVATPEQIRFLRELAPPNIRIKASGGIKKAQQVRELLAAGADVVGTSSAVQIIEEVAGGRLRESAVGPAQY